MRTSDRGRDAALAAALFIALTLALTAPLLGGLAHDIPSDFGDPLLNSWILAWDASHILSGGRGWWNANIYYPHPIALAYSEHLAAQALQILPVYALTKNPILCYNLAFLSTFILSGVGMFLLVRELTGDRTCALAGGVAFAFAPYRIASLPHLQVLSSSWMPFVLFLLRRYFATRRTAPLAGAVAAWLLQNLSCGYYLLFFSPVVLLYLAWELTAGRLWRERQVLLTLAAAVGVVAIATAPFVWPYFALRRLGFDPRSLSETRRFSADVFGYFTADPNLRVWGSIARAWPKAEGSLFPGLTVAALAAAGAARGLGRARAMALAAAALPLLALLLGHSIRLPILKVTSLPRALGLAMLLYAIALATSARERAAAAAWLRSPAGLFTLMALFAVVMSFGPQIEARGRVVAGTSLYAAFYRWVPGFDGLRVPGRFGMIVAFALAVLAALGLMSIRRPQLRARIAAIAAALMIVESFAAPIPVNQNAIDYRQPGLAPLPPTLTIEGGGPPAVYRYIAALPESSVVLELPLGEPAFDVRYMFYSTGHWRPLVNGYTGGQPYDYTLLDHALQDITTRPDRAWRLLVDSGVTHVVVHETFYAGDRGPRVSGWLGGHGATEVAAFGGDRVFHLSSANRNE